MEITPTARRVLEARYLAKDGQGNVIETPKELFHRVAHAIAQGDLLYGAKPRKVKETEEGFFRIMNEGLFLPNSPTLMNAGRPLNQLSACFVLPVEDNMQSIMQAMYDMAMVQRTGGGTGFSFSHLRPEGDIVSTTGGSASGPVSFMRMYGHVTDAIQQGGWRRGANMGVLDASHPDIRKFIHAKDDESITNFNISVWASDEFMKLAARQLQDEIPNVADWSLRDPRDNQIVGWENARNLLHEIAESAWKTGDPGLLFADRINESNPTPWLGDIESTNPCGEQPLLPYEACCLGSINLGKFVDWGSKEPNWKLLELVVIRAVHFLDNIIDVQSYPIPKVEKGHKRTRKIGLGVMGWADMLAKMGIEYDSDEALRLAERVGHCINTNAFDTSIELAELRGSCPAFSQPEYPQVRNATRTTIAPTGSISLIANCSSGIEPYFARTYVRQNVLGGQTFDEEEIPLIAEFRLRDEFKKSLIDSREANIFPKTPTSSAEIHRWFKTAHEITPLDHITMQAAWQKNTDNSVSKTINLPNSSSVEDIFNAYVTAWRAGCKGVTVFRDGCREKQVLVNTEAKQRTDPKGRERSSLVEEPIIHERATNSDHPKVLERATLMKQPIIHERPTSLRGWTERVSTGLGHLFITVNEHDGRPFEVFAQVGKAGSDVSAFTEGVARLVSLALRSDIPPSEIVGQLKGIGGSVSNGFGTAKVLSVPDAIGRVLARYISDPSDVASSVTPTPLLSYNMCPQCHWATLVHAEGCEHCTECGYERC